VFSLVSDVLTEGGALYYKSFDAQKTLPSCYLG
jgi:hypothetical protein